MFAGGCLTVRHSESPRSSLWRAGPWRWAGWLAIAKKSRPLSRLCSLSASVERPESLSVCSEAHSDGRSERPAEYARLASGPMPGTVNRPTVASTASRRVARSRSGTKAGARKPRRGATDAHTRWRASHTERREQPRAQQRGAAANERSLARTGDASAASQPQPGMVGAERRDGDAGAERRATSLHWRAAQRGATCSGGRDAPRLTSKKHRGSILL